MIITLKGKIDQIAANFVILELAGIGYKIYLNSETLNRLKNGEIYRFYLHQHVRESELDLYGFLTFEELELFELLLSVSGIGPKAGLAILSSSKPEEIKSSILNNELDLFIAISGVGKKTATRIILELKEKISADDLSVLTGADSSSEVMDALKNLGYKTQEIKKILPTVPKDLKSPEEKVRWILQQLSK